MANSPAPIETKVVAFSWTTMGTGLLTWALVSWIPAWHNGIPPQLANFLPLVVGAVLGTIAGWFAKHTPRMDETIKIALQLLSDPDNKLKEFYGLVQTMAATKNQATVSSTSPVTSASTVTVNSGDAHD